MKCLTCNDTGLITLSHEPMLCDCRRKKWNLAEQSWPVPVEYDLRVFCADVEVPFCCGWDAEKMIAYSHILAPIQPRDTKVKQFIMNGKGDDWVVVEWRGNISCVLITRPES